eukprot:Opistho-1_new@60299
MRVFRSSRSASSSRTATSASAFPRRTRSARAISFCSRRRSSYASPSRTATVTRRRSGLAAARLRTCRTCRASRCMRALRTPQGVCSLYAKNADAKAKWMAAFKSAVTSNMPDAHCHSEERPAARPHSYKLTTYTKPTFCFSCRSLLWGIINQGFRCQQCGIDSHKKCIALITGNCGDTAPATSQKTGLQTPPSKQKLDLSGTMNEPKFREKLGQSLSTMSLQAAQQQPQAAPSQPVVPKRPVASSAPEPGAVCVALYPYDGGRGDELCFYAGDEIRVIDTSNAVWWKGELRGAVGLFPSSYVQLVADEARRTVPLVPAASTRSQPSHPPASPMMHQQPRPQPLPHAAANGTQNRKSDPTPVSPTSVSQPVEDDYLTPD